MSDRSKAIQATRPQGTLVASVLFAGLLAMSATYALPLAAPGQPGGSLHAKNGDTPAWILDRQAQTAHQTPVILETDEPSFWI